MLSHRSIIHADITNNHLDCLKFDLFESQDCNRLENDLTPLMLAIKEENYSAVSILINNEHVDVNVINDQGETALHILARRQGSVPVVEGDLATTLLSALRKKFSRAANGLGAIYPADIAIINNNPSLYELFKTLDNCFDSQFSEMLTNLPFDKKVQVVTEQIKILPAKISRCDLFDALQPILKGKHVKLKQHPHVRDSYQAHYQVSSPAINYHPDPEFPTLRALAFSTLANSYPDTYYELSYVDIFEKVLSEITANKNLTQDELEAFLLNTALWLGFSKNRLEVYATIKTVSSYYTDNSNHDQQIPTFELKNFRTFYNFLAKSGNISLQQDQIEANNFSQQFNGFSLGFYPISILLSNRFDDWFQTCREVCPDNLALVLRLADLEKSVYLIHDKPHNHCFMIDAEHGINYLPLNKVGYIVKDKFPQKILGLQLCALKANHGISTTFNTVTDASIQTFHTNLIATALYRSSRSVHWGPGKEELKNSFWRLAIINTDYRFLAACYCDYRIRNNHEFLKQLSLGLNAELINLAKNTQQSAVSEFLQRIILNHNHSDDVITDETSNKETIIMTAKILFIAFGTGFYLLVPSLFDLDLKDSNDKYYFLSFAAFAALSVFAFGIPSLARTIGNLHNNRRLDQLARNFFTKDPSPEWKNLTHQPRLFKPVRNNDTIIEMPNENTPLMQK